MRKAKPMTTQNENDVLFLDFNYTRVSMHDAIHRPKPPRENESETHENIWWINLIFATLSCLRCATGRIVRTTLGWNMSQRREGDKHLMLSCSKMRKLIYPELWMSLINKLRVFFYIMSRLWVLPDLMVHWWWKKFQCFPRFLLKLHIFFPLLSLPRFSERMLGLPARDDKWKRRRTNNDNFGTSEETNTFDTHTNTRKKLETNNARA